MPSPFAGMALAVDTPQRLHLIHPVTREPLDAWLDLLSYDGQASQRHRAERDERVRRLRRELTAEEAADDLAGHVAALTAGWRLRTLDGGELDVPCTPENARLLYGDRALSWVRLQALEFLADRGNWKPPSAPTS